MYIGRQPIIGNFVKLDAITTSATTTFNLTNGGVAYYPQSANNCLVSLNGILQAPTDSYTISGSTIVFSSALTTNDVIDFIIVLGDVLNIGTPSDNTVSTAKIVNGAITSAKLATGVGGKVLQVVQATDGTARTTTSNTFVTASNTLTVNITPSSASNKILVILNLNGFGSDSANTNARSTVYRGATDISPSNGFSDNNIVSGGAYYVSGANCYLDSPNTTSQVTYQCYIQNTSGSNTVRINNGSFSSLTCLEIAV